MDDLSKNNEFDKKIKERYAQFSVDPDRTVWNDVDSKLLARKLARSQQRMRIAKAASIVFGIALISLLVNQLFLSERPTPGKLDPNSAQVENTDQSGTIKTKTDEVIAPNSETAPKIIEDRKTIQKSPLSSTVQQLTIENRRIESSIVTKGSIKTIDMGDLKVHLENIEKNGEFINPLTPRSKLVAGNDFSILNVDSIPINKLRDHPEKLKEPSLKLMNRWIVEIYGAPAITSRLISVNQEFIPKPTLGKSYFNSLENAQIGGSGGVTAGYRISQKLLLKSGLDITTQKLKFQTKVNNLVPVGDTDFLLYTSFGEILLTLEGDQMNPESIHKSSVSLNYISLPVGIEYKVMPNTSVALDLDIKYLFSQGVNWESSGDGDNNQSINGIQGLRPVNFGFSIGIVKEQKLSKNLSLLINPVFRSNLTTINNSAPVKAYPNSFGIRLGLRKYF